jgi:hypothetical protein
MLLSPSADDDVLNQVPFWVTSTFIAAVVVFGLLNLLARPVVARLREAVLWSGLAIPVGTGVSRNWWIVATLELVFAALVGIACLRWARDRHAGPGSNATKTNKSPAQFGGDAG